MKFVPLTYAVLQKLKDRGFTALHSTSLIVNKDPTWMPVKVDIGDLVDLDSEMLARITTPKQQLHFLVIDDALQNIREEDLPGSVWDQ